MSNENIEPKSTQVATDAFDEISLGKELLNRQVEAELTKFDKKDIKVTEKTEITQEVSDESTKEIESLPTTEFNELELEQMEKGWDPKGKYDAETFKKIGEIIDAKRKASKLVKHKEHEVDELTKTVKELVQEQRQLKQASYEKALKDLQFQKMEKIKDGDVQGVMNIEQEIAQQQARSAPVQPQNPYLAPEVKQFEEKHKEWLNPANNDPMAEAMRGFVQQRVAYFEKTNPNIDVSIAINDIEDKLKQAFPTKFEVNKPKMAKVNVSTPATRTKDISEGRLSFEQKMTYKAIVAADPTYTIKEYVETLETLGKIS